MPDKDRRDRELGNQPVPIASRHSRRYNSDQSQDHRENEDRNDDTRDPMTAEARQDDPPDDVQRDHQPDDGENEAHANNLRMSRRFWRDDLCVVREWDATERVPP